MGEESNDNDMDTGDEIEALIDCVREQKLLYDLRLPDYKNAGRKELVWIEIAGTVKQDVTWCRNKWRYLRDQYRKKKNSLKGKSGKAAQRVKKWAWFSQLSFLDPFLEDNSTTGNLRTSEADVPVSTENDPIVDTEEPGNTEGSLPVDTPKATGKSHKPKRTRQDIETDLDIALTDYLGTRAKEDCHHHFGMSVAEKLRSFDARLASLARMKIEQLLFELEFPTE